MTHDRASVGSRGGLHTWDIVLFDTGEEFRAVRGNDAGIEVSGQDAEAVGNEALSHLESQGGGTLLIADSILDNVRGSDLDLVDGVKVTEEGGVDWRQAYGNDRTPANAHMKAFGEQVAPLNLSDWTVDTGTVTEDSPTVDGSPAPYQNEDPLKFVADGASENKVEIQQEFFGDQLDISGKHFTVAVFLESTTSLSSDVFIRFDDDSGNEKCYRAKIDEVSKGAWHVIGLGIMRERVSDGFDPTSVIRIRISNFSSGSDDVTFYLDSFRAVEAPDTSHIFVGFDDNHQSQYDEAFPLLSDYGIPGTLWFNPDTIGNSGKFSQAELEEMRDAGWLAANHGYTHGRLSDLTETEQIQHFEKAKRWIIENKMGEGHRLYRTTHSDHDAKSLPLMERYSETSFTGSGTSGDTPADIQKDHVGHPLILRDPHPVLCIVGEDNYRNYIEAAEQAIQENLMLGIGVHDIPNSGPDGQTARRADLPAGSETGTATGATSTTLEDTSKSWGTSNDGEWRWAIVEITSDGGSGATGQKRLVESNTADTLTLLKDWDTTPQNGDEYAINDTISFEDLCIYLDHQQQEGKVRAVTPLDIVEAQPSLRVRM